LFSKKIDFLFVILSKLKFLVSIKNFYEIGEIQSFLSPLLSDKKKMLRYFWNHKTKNSQKKFFSSQNKGLFIFQALIEKKIEKKIYWQVK